MRAYTSLRRRGDFARVARRGKRRAGPHLTCFVADGRRRIKAILDRYPLGAPPWRDILFIARPGAGELAWPALVDEVALLLRVAS